MEAVSGCSLSHQHRPTTLKSLPLEKEKSYYALASFCENMGEEILPFLDPLMGKLLNALQSSPRNFQETCMSAIGSVASAAEQAFIPYAKKVLELMKHFMVLTTDEDLCSRARATELVGIVAMDMGWSSVSFGSILMGSLVMWLKFWMMDLLSSAVDINDSDEDDNINGFGGVSSDDEAHDEPRVRNISIRTGVLDEKAAATQALGLFALHTKSAYAPYLEESLKILVRHSSYFHEDVRLQSITALKQILTAAQAVFQGHYEGATKIKEVLDSMMNIYIKTMTEDDDKEVVAQACMSTADIIKDLGYLTVEHYATPFRKPFTAVAPNEQRNHCFGPKQHEDQGGSKVTGKAVMLDEIINYVQSLQ